MEACGGLSMFTVISLVDGEVMEAADKHRVCNRDQQGHKIAGNAMPLGHLHRAPISAALQSLNGHWAQA
jgi:hypothetical protein